jgi:small Trp-rich protein
MFFVIVGVVLILLNLAGIGPFALWNWDLTGDLWKFCVPFALAAVWWAWADGSGYNKRRETEKMEARKTARRASNMEALGMDDRGRRKGRKR